MKVEVRNKLINNTKVYGIEESIIASGYPKSLKTSEATYSESRASKLASCKSGTGHDCFLKGIIVQMDVSAPSYWWPQFQRYHFADIISSQSKMHCLEKFDITSMCNEYVNPEVIKILETYIRIYNENRTIENFMWMISNVPMGMKLTARITTNYLQLKTIYIQRKNHKLPEWKMFCEWILTLPLSNELIVTSRQ